MLLGVAACGSGSGSPIVVRMGPRTITKAALDRWTAIEAVVTYEAYPRGPVPKGIIPDPPNYTNCVAYLQGIAPRSSLMPNAQLKQRCQAERSVLQNQMLEILITSYWLKSEAASKGLNVSYAEAKRVLNEKFGTKAARDRFLALTGEREADEEFLLKRTMLANKLLAVVEGSANSPSDRRQAAARFYSELTKRWARRTDCRVGYVVAQCRQHHT